MEPYEISLEEIQKFKDNCGNKCPVCGKEGPEDEGVDDINEWEIYLYRSCGHCKSTWTIELGGAGVSCPQCNADWCFSDGEPTVTGNDCAEVTKVCKECEKKWEQQYRLHGVIDIEVDEDWLYLVLLAEESGESIEDIL